MSDVEQGINEYVDLPDDPEMAFAALQHRKYADLELIWESDQSGGWYHERRYVDTLIAFDEVYNLGILTAYRSPPNDEQAFSEFFQDFRRHAEISSQKIKMEGRSETQDWFTNCHRPRCHSASSDSHPD